jgi:hypothetical protein
MPMEWMNITMMPIGHAVKQRSIWSDYVLNELQRICNWSWTPLRQCSGISLRTYVNSRTLCNYG